MWSWTWQWKDELATERRLFYGRLLRRKPTFVSLQYLPHFFALTGNVGEPDDYLQAYREGRMSLLAKDIYEYLRAHGRCSTWVLRKRFVVHADRAGAFHRALGALQERCLIAKVAEQERGSYAYIWDTFDRWLPQAVRDAGTLSAEAAAAALLERYLRTVGAAAVRTAAELFAWPGPLLQAACAVAADRVRITNIDGQPVLLHAQVVAPAGRSRPGR